MSNTDQISRTKINTETKHTLTDWNDMSQQNNISRAPVDDFMTLQLNRQRNAIKEDVSNPSYTALENQVTEHTERPAHAWYVRR